MKKRVTVNLDAKTHEIVQAWLRSMGMTFSGFLTALLDEFAKSIEGQPTFDKPVSEMTVKEVGEAFGYWFKKVQEE